MEVTLYPCRSCGQRSRCIKPTSTQRCIPSTVPALHSFLITATTGSLAEVARAASGRAGRQHAQQQALHLWRHRRGGQQLTGVSKGRWADGWGDGAGSSFDGVSKGGGRVDGAGRSGSGIRSSAELPSLKSMLAVQGRCQAVPSPLCRHEVGAQVTADHPSALPHRPPTCSKLTSAGDPDALEMAAGEMAAAAAALVSVERSMLQVRLSCSIAYQSACLHLDQNIV